MKLKPCPFCGGTDLKIIDKYDSFHNKYARGVFCQDCHCTGRHAVRSGWTESDDEAAEEWNERTSERVDREELARIISQEVFHLHWDLLRGTHMIDVMGAVQAIEDAGYKKLAAEATA